MPYPMTRGLSTLILTLLTILHVSSFADSLIEPGAKLETLSNDFELADGPSWDGSTLWFPDVKAEKLYRYSPKTGKFTVAVDAIGRISASFYNHGKLYLSDNGASGIAWLNGSQKNQIAGQDPEANPPAKPNDLVVDSEGGIYYTLTRPGQVVYINPNGAQHVVAEGIVTPNGITLSPDNRTLYVSAATPKEIWAYPVATPGKLGPGKILAIMDDGDAKAADGMTMDRAGNIYCAGPNDVWIWSPSGKLLDKIRTPERPINCTFGDPDMRSLYITGFGGLHRIRMTVSGLSPEPPSQASTSSSNRPSTVINHQKIKSQLNVVYTTYGDRKLLMDVFSSNDAEKPRPAVVVVHGGGWLNGDKTKFRALTLALAERGYVTAAIEYRLGGEAHFPAAIHDCNAAVRYLKANAKQLGIDPDRIGAIGGSAGGHLVGLMASGFKNPQLQGSGGYANQSSKLKAAIVMAGPLQMITGSVAERSRTHPSESNSNKWLGKTVDEAPELYRLADAFEQIDKDCPPILFMTGEFDNPSRNRPSRDRLQSLGIRTNLNIYMDGKHGCWNQLPWFTEMVDDMDTFFRETL
jgi:gluconolactonase